MRYAGKARPEIQNQHTEKATEPGFNRWLVFAIIAMALLMNTVDSTIVATALHTLQRELHTTVSWAGWTLTAYAFGFVLMLPLSAKLSMRFGYKRIFILSVITFTITSVLCGISNNISLLIFLRVIQSIGGAGITPAATGIIVEHFGHSRDRFVSLFGSIFPIGALIGPAFGGYFVQYWSWRDIFFINVPFGIAVITLGLIYIPSDKYIRLFKGGRMDFMGLVYLALGILPAMFGATFLGDKSVFLPWYVYGALFALSIAGCYIFLKHLKRVKFPFIIPRFIYGKGFGVVNLLNVIYPGLSIGAIALVPLYAVSRYGISELRSGTLLIAQGIASVILSTVITMLLRKTGYKLPLYVGGIILVIGVGLMALPPQFHFSPFLWLGSCAFLIGMGTGIMSPPSRNAGLQLAPEQSATIAAVRSIGIQMGQIISIAVATAIIAGAQHANAAHALVYVGTAIILFFLLPLISRVPDHKGSW